MKKIESTKTLNSACTSFLVGKEMTIDNSFISARSEDWDSKYAKHFEFHEDTEEGPTEFVAKDSSFRCQLPKEALGYSAMPPYNLPNHWGSAGFNTAGVGMSATETIFSNEKALKADPVVESGVAENSIYNITIPYIHTAREGVKRVGELIEKHGAAEGFGISFLDTDELWYLETASGHRWMATRIPDDAYFVSGNQSRFRKYNPEDKENYMGSSDLIDFAIKYELYDPQKEAFDFHEAYARDVKEDETYNYPRVWYLQSLYSSKLKNDVAKNTFPVFAQADKKIAVEDVKEAFRTHYNDTEHDPYLHENPDEPYRPISIYRTTQVHVLQIRPNLPQAIGRINYTALGMAALSLYLPYYQGLKKLPKSYQTGNDQFSDDSVYWRYRKVQTLAMTDYNAYAPIVKKAYAGFEQEISRRQQEMETNYLKIYEKESVRAEELIQNFTDKMIADAADLNDQLINQLFTKMAADIQEKYLFHGA